MKSILLALGFSAIVAAAPGLARAGVFDFSLTGAGYNTAGVLTTAGDLSATGTLITDISGMQNGKVITRLDTPGSYPFGSQPNDNLLFSGTPSLDNFGFSFRSAGQNFNVFYKNGYYEFSDPGATQLTSFILTDVTSVPEPASIALLIFGLLTMSVFYVRRPS